MLIRFRKEIRWAVLETLSNSIGDSILVPRCMTVIFVGPSFHGRFAEKSAPVGYEVSSYEYSRRIVFFTCIFSIKKSFHLFT
jgi:hypothetical protein